jgi:hypothetical protein
MAVYQTRDHFEKNYGKIVDNPKARKNKNINKAAGGVYLEPPALLDPQASHSLSIVFLFDFLCIPVAHCSF